MVWFVLLAAGIAGMGRCWLKMCRWCDKQAEEDEDEDLWSKR